MITEHVFESLLKKKSITTQKWDKQIQFASPCQSKSMFFLKAASIVTDPLLWGVISIVNFLSGLIKLLEALVNVIMLNPVASLFDEAFSDFNNAVICVFFVILIPIVATIDLIGSSFATLKQLLTEEAQESDIEMTEMYSRT